MEYLDHNHQIAYFERSGIVISAESYDPADYSSSTAYGQRARVVSPREYAKTGLDKVALWGPDNLRPQNLISLLAQNHINAQLIYTKVSLAVRELMTFRWEMGEVNGQRQMVKVPFMPPSEVWQLLRSHKTIELVRARATDFLVTGNAFMKVILARDPNRGIADFQHVDASYVRAELERYGQDGSNNYYVSKDWKQPVWKESPDNGKTMVISRDATVRRFPTFRREEPRKFFQSIHHDRLYWTGEPYYGIQPWHAAHAWIDYSNTIPQWLGAAIRQGASPKFHIKYPDGYFDYLEKEFEDPKKRQAEKERVFQKIENSLMGVKGAMKTIFTPVKIDPMTGQQGVGWEIIPLNSNLNDEAYVKAFAAGQNAAVSSHGLDPALAAIHFEGKMPISGSDKRISIQIHEVTKNDEVREIMTRFLYILRDDRGWDPNMEFGFVSRNIVPLSENPTGMTPENFQ